MAFSKCLFFGKYAKTALIARALATRYRKKILPISQKKAFNENILPSSPLLP